MRTVLYFMLIFSFFQVFHVKNEKINKVRPTEKGMIEGTFNPESGVYVFKDIAFAKAPVGSLRWKSPQNIDGWKDTLDTKKFGPICMQASPKPFSMWTSEFMAPAGNMNEDCLNLNVWTKKGAINSRRPVVVFLHGGAFTGGSGSVPIYNGEKMAKKNVVFVTINYRLGIFGFMSSSQLSKEDPHHASGNYGLLDQIAALKWVKKNITAFGGDPDNITIAGQSAGAASVSYLVCSPLAKGIFQRAIAESGGRFFNQTLSLPKNEEIGDQIMGSLGINSISKLRKLSADSLLKVQMKAQFNFDPVIDGYVIPEPLLNLYKKGTYNDTPILTGWNAGDGNIMGPSKENASSFRKNIKQRYGKYSNKILKMLPATNDSIAQISQYNLRKALAGMQAWKWMQLQNESGKSDVFIYYFERNLPYTEAQQNYGAFHTGEVPYAYNTLHKSNRPWQAKDHKLADTMSSYWVNFARNGNPNGDGLPYWPPSTPDKSKSIILGDTVRADSIPEKNLLQLLNTFYSNRPKKK